MGAEEAGVGGLVGILDDCRKACALADGLIVHGHAGAAPARNGVRIDTEMDHRIAMSFLVYGLAAQGPVQVAGCEMIDTSFPDFMELMTGLGARMEDTP